MLQDQESLQSQMDSLSEQVQQAKRQSIAENSAFVPAAPEVIVLFHCQFLHGGWLHLLGYMWFLWLAGFFLEDFWGVLCVRFFI
jgi:membrane associated rhomboid family serine protease